MQEMDKNMLVIMHYVNEDSVEFFKYFLYTFQYPGGHQKSRDVAEIIKQKIKFKYFIF